MLSNIFSQYRISKNSDQQKTASEVGPVLMDKIASDVVLDTAYQWLMDHHAHVELPAWDALKPSLQAQLRSGEYCFQPVTLTQMMNRLGEPESQEIWRFQDQIVLKAISLVLKEAFGKEFSQCCHHLEGRNGIKKTVRQTREYVQANPQSWVFKTDVQGYYTQIDHNVLYQQLCTLLPEEQYLQRLLWQYLKHSVYDGHHYYDVECGISLGCPLSPLMAALYLKPLDDLLESQEVFYARFMDEFVVIAPTRWRLGQIQQDIADIFATHLPSLVKESLSPITRLSQGFDLLGYHFVPTTLAVDKVALQRRDLRMAQLYEPRTLLNVVSALASIHSSFLGSHLHGSNEQPHSKERIQSPRYSFESKWIALSSIPLLTIPSVVSQATIYQLGNDPPSGDFMLCDGVTSASIMHAEGATVGCNVGGCWGSGYIGVGMSASWGTNGNGDSSWANFGSYYNSNLASSQANLPYVRHAVDNDCAAGGRTRLLSITVPFGWVWARWDCSVTDFDAVSGASLVPATPSVITAYGISTNEEPTLANTAGLTNNPTCADAPPPEEPSSPGLPPLPPTMNLTVDFGGNGTGSVELQRGRNYPGTDSVLGQCNNTDECVFANLETATWVKITPQAAAGSRFAGWGGSTYCREGNPFMVSNVTCTAYFATIQAPYYPLTVTKTGTGEGTITSVNPGIDCGATCASNFDSTVEVELSAVPAANSQFVGWSGDCGGNSPHTHLKVSQAKTCTAQFDLLPPPPPAQYLLTITKMGDGNGVIASSDSQIHCGMTCNGSFNENSEVTLQAGADNHSQFIEWQGDCSGHDNPTKVTMTAAKSCVGVFDLKQLPPPPPPTIVTEKLSVEKHGNGRIKITTDPQGLLLDMSDTIGAEASADYEQGSVVKLQVEVGESTVFDGFGGDPDCADAVVTMDASKHCIAHLNFRPVKPPVVEPPVQPPVEPPVVVEPPVPPEPDRGSTSDRPPLADESICPTERHLNIHLDDACDADGQTIEKMKVIRGGSLADAIITGMLTNDGGLVSDLTLESTAILEGGFVTNFVTNKGLMKNFTFVGQQIQGGTLGGIIIIGSQVSNEIRDVILAPGTTIQGKIGKEFVAAKLAGKIKGDAKNPAKLENVTLVAGTNLDNVILGKDVILEEGVILGENVTFADGSQQESVVCEPNALGLDQNGKEVKDFKACFTLQPGKEHVEISMQVDPAHAGQKADLLFVIKASATEWYTLDKTTWKAWNGNLDSLKVKESFKKLPETIVLEFSNSEFNELGSELTLFVGYELPDGTIVYNQGEPL